MLNEDKLKLMIELSIYEKKHKKSIENAKKYFKEDYIARNLIEIFFKFTFAYLLITLVFCLYSIQIILSSNNIFEFSQIIKIYIFTYIILLFLFETIGIYIYAKRYEDYKKKNYKYILILNRLEKRYEFASRIKELAKEVDNAKINNA